MDLGCGITFDIFTHVSYTGRLNLLIKKKIQVGDIQVDDLAEGYNAVTSYKENTWKQSVKIKRDVVEICCFKASYKQITWKQSVKINRDVVEICCFKASYKQITWKQSVKINRDVVEICCFKERKWQ